MESNFILIFWSKKDFLTSSSNFCEAEYIYGNYKQVAWMFLFCILSYFKNALIISVTTFNKPR